jgi:hypothetical protein
MAKNCNINYRGNLKKSYSWLAGKAKDQTNISAQKRPNESLHTSYSGSGDWEDHDSRPVWTKS